MNFVQLQIKPLHHPPGEVGRTGIKTLGIEKLVPINDAQHRQGYRANAGKRVFAIFVMLAMIIGLVWTMGQN